MCHQKSRPLKKLLLLSCSPGLLLSLVLSCYFVQVLYSLGRLFVAFEQAGQRGQAGANQPDRQILLEPDLVRG